MAELEPKGSSLIRITHILMLIFTLAGCGGSGDSGGGGTTLPSAPTGLTATPGNGQVTISWSNVSGATSYNLYMASVSGVKKTNYNSLADGMKHPGVTSPYLHTALTNGTTYYFIVTTVNSAGESVESTEVSATPSADILNPPTGVSASPGNGQVTISWSNVSGATSYNLYWATTSGVTQATGAKITNATSPYVHTGLTNGTTYYYVVTVVNSAGESAESAEVSATPMGTWIPKAPMPTRRYHLAVGVVNNILYAVGGYAPGIVNGMSVDTVEAYDPVTDTWTTKASMPTARDHLAVGVVNNILYAVGGYNNLAVGNESVAFATVEAYNPSTDTWTPKASMPTGRYDLAVGEVNGILYAIGGEGDHGYSAAVEAYDPATDTWTTKAKMPKVRTELAAGVVNSILYAVGGFADPGTIGNFRAVNTVNAYDPTTNTWDTRNSMPTARLGLAIGVVNDTIYAVGGFVNCGFNLESICAVKTVEAYDPATNTWIAKPPMNVDSFTWAAGGVNNVLYVIGSYLDLEAFTPP